MKPSIFETKQYTEEELTKIIESERLSSSGIKNLAKYQKLSDDFLYLYAGYFSNNNAWESLYENPYIKMNLSIYDFELYYRIFAIIIEVDREKKIDVFFLISNLIDKANDKEQMINFLLNREIITEEQEQYFLTSGNV